MIWLLAATAVLCNVSAQLSMKLANHSKHTLENNLDAWVSPWLSPWIIAAVMLYGISFVLSVRLYALLPLSLITPVMAGATFCLVSVTGLVLFNEPLSDLKFIGMILIILGIYCLVR
ncbi:MAG: hypothetical protein KAG19_04635 [Methylococcales bacterium]|nr:hypothetical protein [Methylococcales bacterium]